jgi:diacylglycerol O-acyltransferase / wax synthase
MTNAKPKNSFSWGDALFLYLERPGQPLSIASVSIFEGDVSLKACRHLVASKLSLIPRYTQRVAFPPLNLGLPTWQYDPMFDIRNHIRQVTLRNGTEAGLKKLASSIVSTHLDRQRPLWDITLVRGLEGNRTGMIARIHHCLADGVAGLGIMNVLMSTSPMTEPLPRMKNSAPASSPPPRDAGAALLDGLVKSSLSAVQGALALHSEAMQVAQDVLANSGERLSELLSVLPEITTPADPLPFNVVCRGPQKFAWTQLDLLKMKEVKNRCGGTVNDVILTVVATTLRRYAELRSVPVKGRSARIMIPVNVRGGSSPGELGNRITFVPVTVPLDIRDPQKLFAFVRQRTEYIKRAHAAELVLFAGGLFSALPPPFWATVGPIASQLPLSLCNIICTNLPGPQMPLFLLGHKMLSWYPYVPIGGELGTNWAILSYNGKAYFGFTCDVGAVPDPENLEEFVEQSFVELYKSAKRVKPQWGTEHESRTTSVGAEHSAGVPRERSRMIPLGEPAPAKRKTRRKRTVRPNVASELAPQAKAKVRTSVAQAPWKPPQSESLKGVATPEVTVEQLAHAVGE